MESKSSYVRECLKELNSYVMPEKSKIKITQQIMEIENYYTSEVDLNREFGSPKKFVIELMGINGIPRRRKRISGPWNNITSFIIAIFILVAGLNIIFNYDFKNVFGYLFIIWGVLIILKNLILVMRKMISILSFRFFGGIIFALIFVFIGMKISYSKLLDQYFAMNIDLWNLFLGLLLIAVAVKLLERSFRQNSKTVAYNSRNNMRYHDDGFNKYDSAKTSSKEMVKIDNSFGKKRLRLFDEKVNYLAVDNAFGTVVINTRDFLFNDGDLIINVENVFGSLEIEAGENTNIIDLIEDGMTGSIEKRVYMNKQGNHNIFVTGTIAFGNVKIRNRW